MTNQTQLDSPPRPRRGLSALFLLLGLVIGAGAVALWGRLAYPPPPAPPPQASVSDETTEAIRNLEAGQQKTADQLQAIQQTLASDQAQMKQLSDEVAAVSDKLEALRQSFGSSQQAARPATPASPPPAAPANPRRGAR
jgi:uncharacterized coiled-coil protein SlyX